MGHVYVFVNPYGRTLKGLEDNSDRIRVGQGLGCLMGLQVEGRLERLYKSRDRGEAVERVLRI